MRPSDKPQLDKSEATAMNMVIMANRPKSLSVNILTSVKLTARLITAMLARSMNDHLYTFPCFIRTRY